MQFLKSFSLVALAASALAGNALADGFSCQAGDNELSLKVFNHVRAEDGTRTGSVLVLSDPAAPRGQKTLARFSEENGTLSNQGTVYLAKVDLRFNDSNQKDARVLDTTLGRISTIRADIYFNYNQPVADGAQVRGHLTLRERDGQRLDFSLGCVRYLKDSE